MSRLEKVTWRDAHFSLDDNTQSKDYLVKTVGWTKKDGRFLRVTSEKTPDGARGVTRIPIELIVRRKRLK